MTAIHSRAMIARLSISQWTARKHDSKVSKEVEKAHAAHDAGRYNKMLVSKALLDPLSRLAGAVRQYHYSMTLPWSDNGDRLLPSKSYMDYTDQIRKFRNEFKTKVLEMRNAYPAEVNAARSRLGTMYNPADYPKAWEIDDRFSIDTEFTSVPNAEDFRVDISKEAAEEIRTSITAALQERQQQAVNECYIRIRDVVGKIHERLSDPKAVFKDSLISNATDLASMLPSLNITDDPALTKVYQDLIALLRKSPKQLRASLALRAHIAQEAQELLAKLP